MKDKNITRGELANLSGIPYTTIVGFYDKGSDNIKLSTLRKLANFFDCTIDYLVDDDVEDKNRQHTKEKLEQLEREGAELIIKKTEGLTSEDLDKVLKVVEIIKNMNN